MRAHGQAHGAAPSPTLPPHTLDLGLGTCSGVSHGFFGRRGGVSRDPLFQSLNCGPGSGDEPTCVAQNRARVAQSLGLAPNGLNTLYQIHSADVITVTQSWGPGPGPKADAMVTDRPGLALGILTADCCPILLADAEARVIGAAHAGWKGALAGIPGAVVAAMEALGAERSRIFAAIGPMIRQSSYEVGPDFPAPFLKANPAAQRFFEPGARAGHWQFDLAGYVWEGLERAGVGSIGDLGTCTYRAEDAYFSYRRTTHRGEPDYGRNISVISLDPAP